MAAINPKALHREVDIEVVKGDTEGYVKTYIVLPSTIYGIASGPLVDAGFANPHSVQIPGQIKLGLVRGQAGVTGEGKNVWPHVHIDDGISGSSVIFANSTH
jgi:hypothetical protein